MKLTSFYPSEFDDNFNSHDWAADYGTNYKCSQCGLKVEETKCGTEKGIYISLYSIYFPLLQFSPAALLEILSLSCNEILIKDVLQ